MDPSGIVAEKETFFFEQKTSRRAPKRYKKLPDELPHDLRFAHLNPRVAALLASKEKDQKSGDFEDGLGSKSLLPQINQTVSLLRQRLDSILSTVSDSQRLLFDEAKHNSNSLLDQLTRILYLFEGLKPHVPNSLENVLMQTWKELVTDAKYSRREWQLPGSKEAFEKAMKSEQSSKSEERETAESEEEAMKPAKDTSDVRRSRGKISSRTGTLPGVEEVCELPSDKKGDSTDRSKDLHPPSITVSRTSQHGQGRTSSMSKPKTRLERYKTGLSVDTKDHHLRPNSATGSRQSAVLKKGRPDDMMSILAESVSDGTRSVMAQPSFVQTIQFQLSNKLCDEKGWVVHADEKDDHERKTMLEWATQRLQLSIKQKQEGQVVEKELGLDQPSQLRYYGDSQKEQLQKYKGSGKERFNSALLKGQKPRIPPMVPRGEGRSLLMTTTGDGSSTVYYPTGRPAIITSSAGLKNPGYYTVVYDNTPEQKMLGSFTPSGRGCCYHGNGCINFLSSDKGGTLADDNGAIQKRWKWPLAGTKLPVTVVVQLNSHLTFRCNNLSQMYVYFSCQKEHLKFHVGAVTGADNPPSREDLGHLVTGFTLSSQAAKDFMKPFKPKPLQPQAKGRKGKGKPRSPVPAAELQKLIADFPSDRSDNDLESDKELAKYQRKIKNLSEDWLEHYRIAMGISSPHMRTLRDSPAKRQRHANSAKLSSNAAGRVIVENANTQVPKVSVSARAPSAPAGRTAQRPLSGTSESATEGHPTVKFDDKPPEEISIEDDQSRENSNLLPDNASSVISSRRNSRTKSAPMRMTTMPSLDGLSPSIGLCTVALRMTMLGEERAICRCSRHHVPVVTDIEYDEFMQKHAPPGQLIIVSVASSLFPEATHGEDTLLQLHSDKNRNRTRPCMQSRSDSFRVLVYDVATAAEFSNHSQPLLLRRHNVIPGMFLMYDAGRLIFCDHIFNGYGSARKDLQKQITKTRLSASSGDFLPNDFKFCPQQGRHGPRSAWGGMIGGAGIDRHGNSGLSKQSSTMKQSSLTSLSSGDSNELPHSSNFSGLESSEKFVRASLRAAAYDMLPTSSRSLRHRTKATPVSQGPLLVSRSKTTLPSVQVR